MWKLDLELNRDRTDIRGNIASTDCTCNGVKRLVKHVTELDLCYTDVIDLHLARAPCEYGLFQSNQLIYHVQRHSLSTDENGQQQHANHCADVHLKPPQHARLKQLPTLEITKTRQLYEHANIRNTWLPAMRSNIGNTCTRINPTSVYHTLHLKFECLSSNS